MCMDLYITALKKRHSSISCSVFLVHLILPYWYHYCVLGSQGTSLNVSILTDQKVPRVGLGYRVGGVGGAKKGLCRQFGQVSWELDSNPKPSTLSGERITAALQTFVPSGNNCLSNTQTYSNWHWLLGPKQGMQRF